LNNDSLILWVLGAASGIVNVLFVTLMYFVRSYISNLKTERDEATDRADRLSDLLKEARKHDADG
jgi:hypothetical protein